MKNGRNNPRHLRALRRTLRAREVELIKVRSAMALDKRLLRELSEARQKLEHEMDEAKRIVGHSSVLFELVRREPTYKFKFDPDEHVPRIVVTDDPGSFSRSALGAELAAVPLHTLLCNVKEEFAGAVHCYVQFADHTLAYSTTQRAIDVTPRDLLIRRIAGELARELVNKLKRR